MAIIEPIMIGTPIISPKFTSIGNNRIMHPIRNMISPLINLCVIKSIFPTDGRQHDYPCGIIMPVGVIT